MYTIPSDTFQNGFLIEIVMENAKIKSKFQLIHAKFNFQWIKYSQNACYFIIKLPWNSIHSAFYCSKLIVSFECMKLFSKLCGCCAIA